jgi:hypothetical protein
MRRGVAGGEALQQGAELGEAAQFGRGHLVTRRNQTSQYAAKNKGRRGT